MYKIGEFSKITNLTIKTLRYYDDIEILVPDSRMDNGYRLYSIGNFEKAMLIRKLRDFDFSISEIKEIIGNCEDEDDLQYFLSEKKELLEKHIKEQRKLVRKIALSINDDHEKGELVMNYSIDKKEYDDVYVIGKKFKGTVKDSGNLIGNMYKQAKMDVNGPMITLYFEMEYTEQSDIEVCVPVKKDVSDSEYSYHKIDGRTCLMTVHKGKYEDLTYAYKALLDYASENSIELDLPIREMCIKGPGMFFRGNPNKYITEIAIPMK